MISVCIIAKNEEKNIASCLERIINENIEIIFVDTGSNDRTIEIAKKYLSTVYEFEWCNDFSKAKNYAVSKATNDIILNLDCDELVDKIDVEAIEKKLSDNPKLVGRIDITNLLTVAGLEQTSNEKISRIFNKNFYEYTGRIHEQITPKELDLYSEKLNELETFNAPLHIIHTGYNLEGEERKNKVTRNLSMLKCELTQKLHEVSDYEKRPKTLDIDFLKSKYGQEWSALTKNKEIPYILYQLGKTYYMDGDYINAVDYFNLGLNFDLDVKLEYVGDMVETYGYALINSGQEKKALLLEGIYQEFSKSADFIFLMGLIYMKNGMFNDAVREFLNATQMQNSKIQGVNSYLAYYNIGVIYECTGNISEAKKYYNKCGNYPLAKRQLQK